MGKCGSIHRNETYWQAVIFSLVVWNIGGKPELSCRWGRRAFKVLCLWDSWADLPEIR